MGIWQLYIRYISTAFGWKIGKWYNAGIGDYKVEIDDETGIPTGKVEVKTTAGQKHGRTTSIKI